jgi:hypothetical protein
VAKAAAAVEPALQAAAMAVLAESGAAVAVAGLHFRAHLEEEPMVDLAAAAGAAPPAALQARPVGAAMVDLAAAAAAPEVTSVLQVR